MWIVSGIKYVICANVCAKNEKIAVLKDILCILLQVGVGKTTGNDLVTVESSQWC